MNTTTFLIRIRVAKIPRDESSLWDILFGRKSGEESWKYSWVERKTHEEQMEEAQRLTDEQLKMKLQEMKSRDLSSTDEQGITILCDCGRVIVLRETQAPESAYCPSCGRKIHEGYKEK